MSLLKRLPGFRRSPPGLEWAVLRRLPLITVVGTALPVAAALLVGLFVSADAAGAKLAATAWIVAVSAVVLHWTAMFTLALACVIVLIAKGPAYVADAYPLIDSDRPRR